MSKLQSVQVTVGDCNKEIAVYCDDVTLFDDNIDILVTSAFVGSYAPTPNTIFKALYDIGIYINKLATDPYLDLRDPCHVWLSKEIPFGHGRINRIGCVELIGRHMFRMSELEKEQSILNSIRAYFHMLDIASLYGVNMSTIALPLLGSGSQNISYEMMLIPLINECISFLKRNNSVKKIYFIEKNNRKADLLSNAIKKSFRFTDINTNVIIRKNISKIAFISYSSADKNIADNLCSKLENKGIKVWYAPRDVRGAYANAIVKAIDSASYFIVILSQNSIGSEHVLSEIDLAFQNLPNNIKFKPLRIDDAIFTPSFKYYLSRQHWMDASNPPLEERLIEFVESLIENDYE